MLKTRVLWSGAIILGFAVLGATWPTSPPQAQQPPLAGVRIGGADIGGVVTGKNGPEAGVWVIAETTELGTRFAKMVVTDDDGRYVIPEGVDAPSPGAPGKTLSSPLVVHFQLRPDPLAR